MQKVFNLSLVVICSLMLILPAISNAGNKFEKELQKEAEALKAENDGKDADIGVRATWTIKSVDVAEQTGNDKAPWRGTITFAIRSETADADGTREVHEFDKDFAYTYNPTIKKWVFDYQ